MPQFNDVDASFARFVLADKRLCDIKAFSHFHLSEASVDPKLAEDKA